jgi:hypothetical protein
MTTTTRTGQLTTQFTALNDELAGLVEACSDEQWRRTTASEGWTVAAVAHHAGEVQQAFTRIVERLARGETYSPQISMDQIHESNARHARDFAGVGKPEALDVLRASEAAMLRLLRALDDERLGAPAGDYGGNELSVEQVIEWVVIGHVREHLQSIQATIAE